MKKIFEWIKRHPIWTVIIFCFILCFIDGYGKGTFNVPGYAFIALFLIALISPYIRKLRKQKADKENADYLAKKITEEMKSQSTADEQK